MANARLIELDIVLLRCRSRRPTEAGAPCVFGSCILRCSAGERRMPSSIRSSAITLITRGYNECSLPSLIYARMNVNCVTLLQCDEKPHSLFQPGFNVNILVNSTRPYPPPLSCVALTVFANWCLMFEIKSNHSHIGNTS